MSERIYAVGDIHGQREMLDAALKRIDNDGGGDARIVFLGDYVDRGPDSAGVIGRLADGLAGGRNWVCLKGNHDRLFEWFVAPPKPRNDPHLIIGYDWTHPALMRQYRGFKGGTVQHDYNWHDAIHSGGGSCGADSRAERPATFLQRPRRWRNPASAS